MMTRSIKHWDDEEPAILLDFWNLMNDIAWGESENFEDNLVFSVYLLATR